VSARRAAVAAACAAAGLLGCSLVLDTSGIVGPDVRDAADGAGGRADDDGSAQQEGDARAGDAAGARLICGAGPCVPGVEVCCDGVTRGGDCRSAAASSPDRCTSSSWAACSGAGSCAAAGHAGELCCATLYPSGAVAQVFCAAPAECAAHGDGGYVIACDPIEAEPCPPGAGTCRAVPDRNLAPYDCRP
jgi:hypothetical protein